jgi:hypothetical protein
MHWTGPAHVPGGVRQLMVRPPSNKLLVADTYTVQITDSVPASCASITMLATVYLTPHVLCRHRSYEDWSLRELIITEG